jgi:mono/diheme cytochrome c family protein
MDDGVDTIHQTMTPTINRAAAAGTRLALSVLLSAGVAHAQQALVLDSGESVYRAACAACHGPDGRGTSQALVGFAVPLPDFTDCSFTSREVAADWAVIAHEGGPVRAFDTRMPAFGQALSTAQIEMAVAHIKSFCTNRAWPAGELNLPRALVTEKAFPEDEAVVSTTFASGAFVNDFLYITTWRPDASPPRRPRSRCRRRRRTRGSAAA